ncbi:unnamed protein product [Rotaria sp. Silwood1]|nr:unnamed protein product [Rotaria sp. Silwood1]CAF1618164.1 unnamed protein product [Rotaria sp. Silwood1]CAF3764321.1 unnamed protein product [Rotaria sp. Silwood1]CAF3819820.1 unnamed protein product [Rotaria sp. Silwood1]CAF4744495.1 unnamed protein product [Rotaria sp. Silwood1]
MSSTQEQEDEIIVVSNALKEDHLPESSPSSEPVKNTDSASRKNNSKFTTTSSSINVTKRYISKFKKEWLSNPKYSSFLKECKNDRTKALCCICNVQFSIQNSGITDINTHMKTKKHQDCVKSTEANKSKTIDASFSTTTNELNRLSAAEGALVFHGVKHSHSYLSQSCTINMMKKCFPDSSIAKNITYDKTKAREIACNVLAPVFTKTIIQDLKNVSYFSISYDASTKGNAKMLPIVAQYFSTFGINHGIIAFIQQQHETADKLFFNIKYVLESNELKLEQLSNCYCHICHNSVKHGNDHLLFDIESAMLKIYAHFSRSSVRLEELSNYFDFIEQEQKVILQHIRLRWLSLLQSIQRLIIVYPVIKSYFLNIAHGQCPKLLLEFFTSNKAECSLYFLKNVLTEVQEANLQLQRYYTTGVTLYSIITDLLRRLNNRLRDDYFGSKVMDLLEKIQHPTEVDDLKKSFRSFIQTVIQYIENYYQDRSLFYKSISIFSETHIETIEWKSIEYCTTYINTTNIDKDCLYNEFNYIRSKYVGIKDKFGGIYKQVQNFISSNLVSTKQIDTTLDNVCDIDVQNNCDTDNEEQDVKFHKEHKNHFIRCDQLWAYLLYDENVPNLRKLIEFAFSIPASNAFCESIFSHMKFLWNNHRNNMKNELIGAELKIKMNNHYGYTQFYNYLYNNPDLLKQIRSSEKYSHIAKVPRKV